MSKRTTNGKLLFDTFERVVRIEGKVDSVMQQMSVVNARIEKHDERIDTVGTKVALLEHHDAILDGKFDDIKDESRIQSQKTAGYISLTISFVLGIIMRVMERLKIW